MSPHRRPRPVTLATAAVAVVIGTVGVLTTPPATSTGAFFIDVAAATAVMGADTLQPPTAMTATGGSTETLTWTPSMDGYGTGYRIDRATSSGGSYAAIGTATPITATGFVDSPTIDGTYWYQARTAAQSWLSAAAGPVSATVQVGDTGYHACTAQAADTGGDGNGYQGTPANACADDGALANDPNSGSGTSTLCTNANKDRHRFSSFGLGVPLAAATIRGISVDYELGIDAISGTNLVCAQLSWDGGATWTAMKSKPVTVKGPSGYTLGGATDTWGRTWLAAQLADATFRVRLINVSSNTGRDFSLDTVRVRVTYAP